jgi:hypothetical protein
MGKPGGNAEVKISVGIVVVRENAEAKDSAESNGGPP